MKLFGIDTNQISRRNIERRIKRRTKKLKAKLSEIGWQIEERWDEFSREDRQELSNLARAILHAVTRQ